MSNIPKPVYVMSEPHLSGYRVILGYNTLEDASQAHDAAVNALPELLAKVKRLEEIEKCARYVDDAPTVGEKSMRLGELLRLCRARAALNQEPKT